MPKYLLCIDDTDNLESPGSGHILNEICLYLLSEGLAEFSRISRHQLFFHPDVPFTSHNSSMCTILTEVESEQTLIREVESQLKNKAAEGSDPGICFSLWDGIRNPEILTAYARRAKKEVLTKEEAYNIAETCGLYLNELGGTGGGIIGAVAGTGLRYSGTDGRFRGKMPFSCKEKYCRPEDFLQLNEIEELRCCETGITVPEDAKIAWLPEIKTVLIDHKSVLPLKNRGNHWQVLERAELKKLFD